MESTRGREKPALSGWRISSRVNQRASRSSAGSTVISRLSASAWKPSMMEAGKGQGWEEW